MRAAIVLLAALGACASPGEPGPDAGPPRGGDANPPAGDGGAPRADARISCADECGFSDAAPGGVPEGGACDPVRDQCAPGLTCRPEGVCGPYGDLEVGDDCSAVGHQGCGYAMVCNYEGAGGIPFACRTLCDPAAPSRCGPTETCYELPSYPGVGICLEN